MQSEQYYPCLMDDDTGQISRRVGPAMPFQDAILYLKQHYSGAWSSNRAAAQLISHEFFKE